MTGGADVTKAGAISAPLRGVVTLVALASLMLMLVGCGKSLSGTSIGAAPPSVAAGEDEPAGSGSGKTKRPKRGGDDEGGDDEGGDDEGSDEDRDDKGDVLSGKQILQKGGVCAEDRLVDEPDSDSDEYVIWQMYSLALADDDEDSFQKFRELFPEQRNSRELREMYWPRIRANVNKFMVEPGRPAFRICRTMPTSDGKKYFIQTNDPRQHPPPITIGESDGGKKKILALTPF